MDKLDIPGTTNGIPFNWDDLEFMTGQGSYDGGIIEAIEGILSAFGDNFIVQGCVLSGGNYTAGWLFLDGEFLKVDAHAATDSYWEKVSTNNADGNKQTQLSGTVDIYQENRGTASGSSGSLLADGNEPRYLNPSWTNLSLINGWSDANNRVRYRKTPDSMIQLHIDLDTPLFGAQSSDVMAQLPVNYRPAHAFIFPIVNENGNTFDIITIDATGNISMDKATAYSHHDVYIFPTD